MTEETKPYRSVSQYNTYNQCPKRYELERIKKVWQRPAAWLSQGTAVHAALEAWERSERTMSLEGMQAVFMEEYSKSIEEQAEVTPNTEYWFASGPYRGMVDIERRFGIGLEQCEKLLDWYAKHPDEKIWITPDGVPAIELEFNVELNGVPVRGFIDAVIETPNGLVVRDLKGLALDTPLPTPEGWTTMQDVTVGDQVLGSDGKPCSVTAKSEIKRIGTYIVKFDDGSEIVCDSEHIWETQTDKETTTSPKAIQEIIRTLKTPRGQSHHKVPVTMPLELPPSELPIKPYVFGCWIGDGKHTSGEISKDEELFELIAAEGYELGSEYRDPRSDVSVSRTVLGIREHLTDLGVRGNKHIPQEYLRGSVKQRLALLQGLMDTDGTWNRPRKTAVFNSTDEGIAHSVAELLHTLGQRPCVSSYKVKGFGKEVDAWYVAFTPTNGLVPFRHPRKLEAMEETGQKNNIKSTRRLIVDVVPGPDVETACIAVSSVDHTYLCGDQMIPTHNTGNQPGDTFQLATYSAAMYQMYGAVITEGDYLMGRTGKPTIPYDLTDEVQEVGTKFAEMNEKVLAGEFEPLPDDKKCNFCGVRTSCPVWNN